MAYNVGGTSVLNQSGILNNLEDINFVNRTNNIYEETNNRCLFNPNVNHINRRRQRLRRPNDFIYRRNIGPTYEVNRNEVQRNINPIITSPYPYASPRNYRTNNNDIYGSNLAFGHSEFRNNNYVYRTYRNNIYRNNNVANKIQEQLNLQNLAYRDYENQKHFENVDDVNNKNRAHHDYENINHTNREHENRNRARHDYENLNNRHRFDNDNENKIFFSRGINENNTNDNIEHYIRNFDNNLSSSSHSNDLTNNYNYRDYNEYALSKKRRRR